MKQVASFAEELTTEEWDLLKDACKEVIKARSESLEIITSKIKQQKETVWLQIKLLFEFQE